LTVSFPTDGRPIFGFTIDVSPLAANQRQAGRCPRRNTIHLSTASGAERSGTPKVS